MQGMEQRLTPKPIDPLHAPHMTGKVSLGDQRGKDALSEAAAGARANGLGGEQRRASPGWRNDVAQAQRGQEGLQVHLWKSNISTDAVSNVSLSGSLQVEGFPLRPNSRTCPP